MLPQLLVAGNPTSYNIQRSLRFRSSASAYLNRTPANAGNRKTWTWSGWVKRGALGVYSSITGSRAAPGAAQVFLMRFGNGDTFQIYDRTSAGTTQIDVQTTAVFRDPSAWYHVVVYLSTNDSTANQRIRLYINGVLQTLSGTFPPQGVDCAFNMVDLQQIGSVANELYFDGYLAEVNFIDGQALTPSSFGQTDAVTGVWTPKKYTGTYGTNGFYLDFKNNTSATTLAYDKSGNGNNWTANNISTTAGATYDSMTDVPTLTSATAANYCTINSLLDTQTYATYSEGNLKVVTTAAGGYAMRMFSKGTMQIPSAGKWYFTINAADCAILIGNDTGNRTQYGSVLSTTQVRYASDGTVLLDGGVVTTVASYTSTDEVGLAVDMDSSTVGIYKNGSLLYTVTSAITAGFAYYPMTTVNSSSTPYTAYWNFGQRPFSYTPPTGFKALNTFNLPDPVIKKPNQYMDATTYTGNSSTQTITNAGGFQPDLVWTKGRSQVRNNVLYDSSRGTLKQLYSNQTAAELSVGGSLTSFNSNGFTLGGDSESNWSSSTYVGWQWKKGATQGFDIVTYTGDGTATRNISHSLGVAPKMMIVKVRNDIANWAVYHTVVGNTAALLLNSTSASSVNAAFWNNTSPTSSVFTVGNGSAVNFNALTYVAYLFAEIPSFSKFGSYTGNGSADGPFVYCGFRPKYVMVKCSSTTANWNVIDTSRNQYNVSNSALFPGDSLAEQTGTTSGYVMEDIVSNGFKLRMDTASINANGATYIYAAFAENPFKYSLAR